MTIYLIVEVYCRHDREPWGFRMTKEEAIEAVEELNQASKDDRYHAYEWRELKHGEV